MERFCHDRMRAGSKKRTAGRDGMRKKALKILVLLSVGYAILMMLYWPIGFTFFTQLSNLFAAFTVLLQLLFLRRVEKTGEEKQGAASGDGNTYPDWLYALKYMVTVSILVTFLVFLCILAPFSRRGFIAAYTQDHFASLCMHLLTPFLMTADFLINDIDHDWDTVPAWYGLIPLVAYLVFIYGMGAFGFRWRWGPLREGIREGMTAPYPFLNYNAPAGWFGFRPETADFSTIGIGVFYMIVLMTLFVYAMSCVVLRMVRHRRRMLVS